MSKSKIKVNLGKNTYPIFIDRYLLNEVGGIINNIGNFSSYIIICDKQISNLHLQKLESNLDNSSKKITKIVIPQ